MMYCALGSPLSAAASYHLAASFQSLGAPRPRKYWVASCTCASAWPCSAALLHHSVAAASDRATPTPFSYIRPRLYCPGARRPRHASAFLVHQTGVVLSLRQAGVRRPLQPDETAGNVRDARLAAY